MTYEVSATGFADYSWKLAKHCFFRCDGEEARIDITYHECMTEGRLDRDKMLAITADKAGWAHRAVFVAAHGCTP